MTSQLDWLGRPAPRLAMPEPRSRKSDPVTSAIAAELHSKGLKGQAAEVLALIEHYPGHTACELAVLWKSPMDYGLRRVAVSRRCSDLAQKHFARRGTARKCTQSGSMQTVWYSI